ncbi:MAG TPA: class I SAM-dependent RNA methyltransferase [Thermodesulfobacteriota bacterium]|nr:class I SAM-dependent RNA methyltransferase [Thermodesulfobacteriota bacterium]
MRIEIEGLAFGGAGIGRVRGKVVFVRGGLPGDTLRVRITREKERYAEAEIEEVISPSPERTEPRCPVFGICGGCQWQHLNYHSQLRAKENVLRDTLERIGGLKGIRVESMVPSPNEYGYRNRITLSVWFQKGGYRIGYHEEGSRRRIAIDGCPIALKPIDEAVSLLSRSLSSIDTPKYPLKKIYIASDGRAAYITLACPWDEDPKRLISIRDHVRGSLGTENVGILGYDERDFEFSILGLRFYSFPSIFIQSNSEVNKLLIKTIIEWAELKGDEKVLDLYSGIGNFSLHLARRARGIMGVDVSARAVELAKRSGEANSISNVVFDASPSELFVEESLKRGDRFDLAILDPPREGAKDILEGLSKLSPGKIIYVSCDPPTLARDLKTLGDLGYRVLKVRPFDMFPQTYHIESLALLLKI